MRTPGFDPAGFSKRSVTSCLACGAAVDKYVKAEGVGKRMGIMPLGAVLVTPVPPRTRGRSPLSRKGTGRMAESSAGARQVQAGVTEADSR